MTNRIVPLLAVASALLAGCSGSTTIVESDAGSGKCVPGASAACACSDGSAGAQLCQSDSTFAACVCADAGPLGDGGSETACVPGQSIACACSDGSSGAQVCDSNNTYGACSCTPAPDGGLADGGSAGPVAAFATAPIDFGLSDCGGVALGGRPIALTNTGGGSLVYSTTTSNANAFSITNAGSGTLAAGQMAEIVISPDAIAANAAAGQVFTGSVTITTNDPARPSTTIPLSITAQGATLQLIPSIATFGLLPVNSTAGAIPLTLLNTGNATVSVSFGAPANGDFSIGYTGGELPPDGGSTAPFSLGANGTVTGLAANFTPSKAGFVTTSSAIATSGAAICGFSATSVPMSGQGTDGAFASSTTDLYFGPNSDGNVACGTTAGAKTFTISNPTGNQSYSWIATLGGSNFSVSPQSGTVGVGLTQTITVTPIVGIPQTSPTTTDLYSDVLTITTDIADDAPHPINLHETAYGAILSISPATVQFGSQAVTIGTSAPLTVTNSGNAPATTVTLATSPVNAIFTVTPAGPSTVAAGGALPVTATFTPATAGVASATLAVGSTDVLCQPLPAATTLTGTGLSGHVGISASTLNFGNGSSLGLVQCGTTAAPQNITFSNSGSLTYTITPTLAKGASSYFTLTMNPSTGIVPVASGSVNGTLTLTVTPKAIPSTSAITPNLYGDLLTVTTNVSGDSPHYIALNMTAQGAILAFDTDSINFGAIPNGNNAQFRYAVTNTGNEPYQLTFPLTTANTAFQLENGEIEQRNSWIFDFAFFPTTTGSFSDIATITPQAGQPNVLCAPLPNNNTIVLSGLSTSVRVFTQQSDQLDFTTVPCGSAAAPQKFIIQNSTSPAVTIRIMTMTLGKTGANALFDVTGPTLPASIAAGANATYTVTPIQIPASASTQEHALWDVLSYTTDQAGDGTHLVYLQETPEGAVLSFSESAVAFPTTTVDTTTTANGTFYLFNNGNTGGTFGLSLAGSDPGDFTLPTSVTVGTGDGLTIASSFTPATTGARSATLTLTGTTNLCAPLPAGITLSGTGQ